MLKRLIVGLFLGTMIGAVVAAVLVQGLGMAVFANSVVAYLSAAATGVITGLVAGKPIWAADGRIEAGLKAFAGMLLGLGAMLVLRWWVKVDVDLSSIKAGHGSIGDLPAVSLPAIAALLATFYELDNSPSDAKKEEAKAGAKSGAGKKVRVEADEDEGADDEEAEEQPASVKKKTR
jgi:hypothetical protein